MMGVLYYLVPRVSGNSISWPGLINVVFWVEVIGQALFGALMIGAGIAGGNAFLAGRAAELEAILAPFMIPITLLGIVCGVIAVVFSIQIIHSATKSSAS